MGVSEMIDLLAGVTDPQPCSPSASLATLWAELVDHVDHVSRLFTAVGFTTPGPTRSLRRPKSAHTWK